MAEVVDVADLKSVVLTGVWVRKVRLFINTYVNYQQIYDNLISFRKLNPATGYIENHHIIMRSMGGSDDESNIVRLTGREHWIAHLLLYKIHKNSQTIHACHMMAMRCEERDISYIKNSRLYEKVRKQHAKLASKRMKISQAGVNNTQYGTRWICNLELKENKKIKNDEEIPEGWICGRSKWKDYDKKREKLKRRIYISNGYTTKILNFYDQQIPNGWFIKENKKRNRKILTREEKQKLLYEDTLQLWNKFKEGNYKSINQFSKIVGHSQQQISKRFSKYIEEYKPNSTKAYSSNA